MRAKTLFILLLIVFMSLVAINNLYPISSSVKSLNDYNICLDHIRSIRIMILNFADDTLKGKYNKTKELFKKSAEGHYSQEYTYYDKNKKKYRTRFHEVKTDLSILFEDLANIYLKRTKEILNSTTKDTFDILISYGKKSGLASYFTRPYDPLRDIKPYKEKEYHFFHDKETIERYLKEGYRKLKDARRIYNHYDLKYIKDKKEKTQKDIDYIIERYLKVISNCRQAKQYGIEIHRILKKNELMAIVKRYRQKTTSLDPIFDDRIPEKFKVDANDNLKLIHSHEQKRIPGNVKRKDTDNKK